MPGKVLEQILLQGVLRHKENRKKIWDRQQGFSKGKSCLTKQVALYEGLTTPVDKGRATDIMSI